MHTGKLLNPYPFLTHNSTYMRAHVHASTHAPQQHTDFLNRSAAQDLLRWIDSTTFWSHTFSAFSASEDMVLESATLSLTCTKMNTRIDTHGDYVRLLSLIHYTRSLSVFQISIRVPAFLIPWHEISQYLSNFNMSTCFPKSITRDLSVSLDSLLVLSDSFSASSALQTRNSSCQCQDPWSDISV